MSRTHQIISIAIAIFLIIVVVNLVRRRKLREEYSWLWLLIGVGLLILSLSQALLLRISEFLGTSSVSTLFLLAIFFLIAIVLQYSVRLSELTDQVRKLGQETALKPHNKSEGKKEPGQTK